MLKINLSQDIDQLAAKLDMLGSKQLPFSVALTMTRLAMESQQEIIRELPDRFTLRNSRTAQGVRYEQATKANLTSRVYDIDYYMLKQEFGGKQVNIGGKKYLAVPMPRIRVTERDLIRAVDQIENLGPIKRPDQAGIPGGKAFIIDAKDGRKYIAVRDRPGRRLKNGNSAGIRLIWVLKAATKYNDRFEMGKTVQGVVRKRLQAIFEQAIKDAMASAKR
jgi:hypothetical protein